MKRGNRERERERERGEGERREASNILKKTNHGFVYSDKNLPSKYHRLLHTRSGCGGVKFNSSIFNYYSSF